MSKVTDLLDALASGDKNLAEVADEFETLDWTKGPARPSTYEELVKAEESDPEPLVEGSFDDVSTAYALGHIDEQQYAVLAKAAGQGSAKSAPAAAPEADVETPAEPVEEEFTDTAE